MWLSELSQISLLCQEARCTVHGKCCRDPLTSPFRLGIQRYISPHSLCSEGDEPKALYTLQVLYQLSFIPNLLLFLKKFKVYFFHTIYSDCDCPSPNSSQILPSSPPIQIYSLFLLENKQASKTNNNIKVK